MAEEKFPKTLAGTEISDIDLDEEVFMFQGELLTEARARQLTEEHFERGMKS
ncbi:hypothetical protein [Mycobacterium sp. Lab-001]|uniref:hypothetical protein n=1 Tax=Mycobacterium sp. Lab-001 TaxID=3410136 RepID=UPI003D16807F